MDAVLDFEAWSRRQLDIVERALETWVPAETPAGLGEAMRYGVLDGGKRVRPLLVLAACEAVQGHREAALRAAVAVELIHAYSLVHDDMPCMDNDILRRGKPTVHVKYGEAQAMLAGDAMQALAFEVLTPTPDESAGDAHAVEPALQARLCGLLARAAGHAGMAGGQAIDLASIGRALDEPVLRDMHRRKTGALLQRVGTGLACVDRLRLGRRAGVPGRRRHPGRDAGVRDARQDCRQGPAPQQADLCVGARAGGGTHLCRAPARRRARRAGTQRLARGLVAGVAGRQDRRSRQLKKNKTWTKRSTRC
jgi:hypothetical protein